MKKLLRMVWIVLLSSTVSLFPIKTLNFTYPFVLYILSMFLCSSFSCLKMIHFSDFTTSGQLGCVLFSISLRKYDSEAKQTPENHKNIFPENISVKQMEPKMRCLVFWFFKVIWLIHVLILKQNGLLLDMSKWIINVLRNGDMSYVLYLSSQITLYWLL